MVLPVQVERWGRGEGTAPGARATSVRARRVAKLPLRIEETRTSGTGSPEHVAKGRADLKLVGQVCLARWAGTTFRQFGKPGLFIDALLVFLRSRLARTEEQRDKEAAEKEERYQKRKDDLQRATEVPGLSKQPDPNHQADPET